jgi:hypothetical protein
MIIWGILRFLKVNILLTTYCANQVRSVLMPELLNTAYSCGQLGPVTAGSGRHGQTVLYLFQNIYSVGGNCHVTSLSTAMKLRDSVFEA